jgi:hypothetical protein
MINAVRKAESAAASNPARLGERPGHFIGVSGDFELWVEF